MGRSVRLTQIDGKFPNLALMKLSAYHKSKGDEVFFKRSVNRDLFEPDYDVVYGSAIFSTSHKKLEQFELNFPNAIVGGTGSNSMMTVEQLIGVDEYEHYDYDIYPHFENSIGFSQRGCRLRCKFCVVPKKEGKNVDSNTIEKIWRGNPKNKKKNIHLLDNDFFGQPNWQEKAQEIIDGGYRVSFTQGINIRLIDQEGANMLSKMKYYDDSFKTRRIYTAWDNKRDEKIFMRGVNYMLNAGIKPQQIMVYFLCNYWEKGLTEDVWYRFNQMVDLGILPYPMIFEKWDADRDLKEFQRWVIRRYYQFVPFENYSDRARRERLKDLI